MKIFELIAFVLLSIFSYFLGAFLPVFIYCLIATGLDTSVRLPEIVICLGGVCGLFGFAIPVVIGCRYFE